MKKYIFLLLIFFSVTAVSAQEVLFIGLYSKSVPGKSGLCADMDMVQQLAKSEEEALQLSRDFKLAHAKESPTGVLVSKGGIILYEFQRPVEGWKCSIRAIGWKKGKDTEDARQLLNADKARIAKEYKATPTEIFEWSSKPIVATEPVIKKEDLDVKYKVIKTGDKVIAIQTFIKNTRTDAAIRVIITTTGEPNTNPGNTGVKEDINTIPQTTQQTYTLQPGASLQLRLANVTGFSIDQSLALAEEEKPGIIDITKHKLRKFMLENGYWKEKALGESASGARN